MIIRGLLLCFLFQGGWAFQLIFPADADAPVQGQGHDEEPLIQAFRIFQVAFGPLEAAGFEAGENMGSMPQRNP